MTRALKELAEHWVNSGCDDYLFPSSGGRLPCDVMNEIGKDILHLLERIETIEEKLKLTPLPDCSRNDNS